MLARVAGATSLADIEQHFRTVCAESWFPAPALHDVREASAKFSHAEIHTIAERLREIAPRIAGAPIAVVVGNEMSFGLVRMIALLLDEIITLKAFRQHEAALAWLADMQRAAPAAPTTR